MKRYRLALTFCIAAIVFTAIYILAVNRVVVAALFLVLVATIAVVDTRMQQSRKRRLGLIGTQTAERERAEEEVPQQPVTRETATKAREALSYPVCEDLRSPPRGADGFSQALLEHDEDRLDDKGSVGVPIQNQHEPGTVSKSEESTAMAYHDWLTVLRKEYLQDFIKIGGATIKFVIPWEHSEHPELREELRKVSEEDHYIFVSVDAATTKVHMIDKLFNEVARQIAWDDLARAFEAVFAGELLEARWISQLA